jgi:hypothetical protein
METYLTPAGLVEVPAETVLLIPAGLIENPEPAGPPPLEPIVMTWTL